MSFAKKHGFLRSFDSAYMEYVGGKKVTGDLPVRKYRDEDYREAQKMYAEAFHRMRIQVGDFPNSVPAPQSEAGRKAWLNDAENYLLYIENGEKHSHTIDPATGYPVKHNLLSATVMAHTAAEADAYATYMMVIGLEKAKEFLEQNPQMEALLVYGEGEGLKVFSTGGVHQRKLK